MIYGFIKDGICINTAVYDDIEQVEEAKVTFTLFDFDDIVLCEDSFGINSYYINGIWSREGNRTPSELRAEAYSKDTIIEWENQLITVDAANILFYNYFAENNDKANQIQVLIQVAKESIREKYPDVN